MHNGNKARTSFSPPTIDDETVDEVLCDKNLLVISHRYNYFTKHQIDNLAEYFDQVHVYVRYNRFTDLSKIIDSDALKWRGRHDKIADDSPDNVYVYPTPLTYLPLDIWYRYLGHHHYLVLRRKLARNPVDFDLIHGHFSWTAGYVSTRLSEEYSIPNVITVHENAERLHHEYNSGNEALYNGWRGADALIRVNKKDCDQLSSFNSSTFYIPNGFSRDRYPLIEQTQAREQLGIDSESTVLFTLGALIPRKNVDMLIDALGSVESEKDICCVIGGRGRERSRLQSKIDNLESGVEIQLLGYVPEEELHLWMNACDIFTLTSDSEGNPTVLFEALGCGKPYIGTNVGGVDEIITSDTYGLLCPPGETETFCSNIQAAIDREWERQRILDYGEQFTWEKITSDICRVFTSVLKE